MKTDGDVTSGKLRGGAGDAEVVRTITVDFTDVGARSLSFPKKLQKEAGGLIDRPPSMVR